MDKIAVSNPSQMPIYCGGLMIPPGETRHFDADMVPPELRPAPAAAEPEAPADPLQALQAHSVKDILLKFPELTDAQLVALGMLEQARGDEARKTLLAAIAEALLTRAEIRAE